MSILKIVVFSISSAAILFILTKLMGNKEISQINLFDYITGITIGSIAAEMATGLEQPVYLPALAMVIYGAFAIGISFITQKSIKARKILSGRPLLILDNGVIYRANLYKARMDTSDFLLMCRAQGYFNLSQIQTAILEFNGSLSILPKSEQRPVTPADMNLSPSQDHVVTNVIMDGKVLKENLRIVKHNENWLEKHLTEQGYKNPKDVFLATCDHEDNLTIYPMVKSNMEIDWFE